MGLTQFRKIVIATFLLIVITGCAHHFSPDAIAEPYGIFSGIWHGLIFPLTLLVNILSWIVSLIGISFLDDIQIIGRPNTGLWYYVGFVIGLSSSASASSQ